jgi:diguanylate cyclase (GGDEF)-like protein/PAS domain S-box-containing protein
MNAEVRVLPPGWALAHRLTAALAGAALLSMLFAFSLYDRALVGGMRLSAEQRLSRASRAADLLIEDHLAQADARYRAVAATPQVRATLELAHARTTKALADQVRAQQAAAGVAFLSSRGKLLARSGRASIQPDALAAERSTLVLVNGEIHAAISLPIGLSPTHVVTLVALEPIDTTLLTRWSDLSGASLTLDKPSTASGEALAAPLERWRGTGLVVVVDLALERAALRNARWQLAWAGVVALALTLGTSTAVARGLVRPVRQIQRALASIGGGDLSVRIESHRTDEIGEMARDVDRMAEKLSESHRELAARVDELRRSREHLTRAQQLARVGSFELDLASAELSASEEFWTLFAAEDLRKGLTTDQLLERLHPEDRDSLVEAFRACMQHGTRAHLGYRIRWPDGSEHFLQTQFHLLTLADGTQRRVEGTVQDLTERRRAEEQIRYMAYHDGLTGLGNRALFSERVNLAVPQARRRGTKLGVLYLDLDDFKRVNDTLGHDVGDDVLRQVADRIVRGTKEAGIATQVRAEGFEPAVARLGGDEFVVLITDVRDARDLALISEHLLQGLQRPYRIGSQEVVISASIGIATWPDDGDRVDALLGNADAAMYHAKAAGRNTSSFYDASMNEAAMRRLSVEVRLREALAAGDLELHFQPKAELSSGRIIGFEALARWHDSELGAVAPTDFIPVAEQTGLIAGLGRWVLDRVCAEVAGRGQALRAAGARVSLNVSTREFGPRFASEFAATIAAHGADPALLQIEITETAIMRNEEATIEALHELKALGVSIALDDFGTGYSSLAYLQRLPVDTLKMDISFIRSIAGDEEAASLTRSIVAMGKALGLHVVAEGVEHEAQGALLEAWGCDSIQGYLVGHPSPARHAFARLDGGGRRQSRSRRIRTSV